MNNECSRWSCVLLEVTESALFSGEFSIKLMTDHGDNALQAAHLD